MRVLERCCAGAVMALLSGSLALFAAPATNRVPDLLVLRRIDWLPAPVQPAMRPAAFPLGWPVERVDHLATAGGRLWIAARKRGGTNAAAARLWSLSALDGRIDPVRGRIEQHAVRGLSANAEGLWLALDGGVAVLDPKSFVIDPFSATEGLTGGNSIGFGEAGRRWFALTEAGMLYALNTDGRAWSRLPGPIGGNARRPVRVESMAGSGEWLLAWGVDTLVARHHAAAQWDPVDERQWRSAVWAEGARWSCAVSDGDGGFWIGSAQGLHFLAGETGSMHHLLHSRGIVVPGGIGIRVPIGFQPSAAAFDAARIRQADGIREWMRLRAQAARVSKEMGMAVDLVTPTSRLPGPVLALARDGAFVWVACKDSTNAARSRVLLWHGSSRRWVAHFFVGLPVASMAVDETGLWLGTDLSQTPTGAPILWVDKRPLMSIPVGRWTPDEIGQDELGRKLAALPVRERAVYAFFAGDAKRVVELLEPVPEDAESLFLQAFAHDSLGLNQPARREAILDRLIAGYPDTPFAELVRGLRPAVRPPPAAATALEPPVLLVSLFKRRDTDGDGRIGPAEWKEWKGEAAPMEPWDKNGDGSIDVAEFDTVVRGAE